MPKGIFPDCCVSAPAPMVSPCSESQLPHTSIGDPPTLAGSFGSVSYGVTAPFLWVLVHIEFCLCSSRLEFLFPSVLWKSCNQILLAFKVRFSGNSFPFCRTPRLRRLMWGSDPSQQWEHFFYIIVLQFVVHPHGENEIWVCRVCTLPTILLKLILYLWMWYIFFFFFFEFQHPPVDGCSIANCNFFSFIFISWRLITLQYCSGFCHTLTWISHGFTCTPHPDPHSHLPLHPIPLGLPSANCNFDAVCRGRWVYVKNTLPV